MMESQDQKIQRILRDPIEIVPYDPRWPAQFQQEQAHLRRCLPAASLGRIEHFGSTAISGLVGKPVIDVLVEVFSLPLVRQAIAPQLEAQGYDYLWRPTTGDDGPPFYAWFIKRNEQGTRTHHIHMVEPDFPHWARLQFRDWLRTHPEVAQAYGELKQSLAAQFPHDRVAYTEGKTAFIQTVMAQIQAASSP
jgi:GrpB-like predicted nucleotidyltransferase (UPF0157 family)